jgi:DNA-directed RNA polymerase subunit K/omega
MTAHDTDDQETPDTDAPQEPWLPVSTNRFLFVDVAAQRAKQLRRGALPRLHQAPETAARLETPTKLERIAMEEVRHGIIGYELPDFRTIMRGDAQ